MDNLTEYEKVLDYFVIVGIRYDDIQKGLSLEEIKQKNPEIISIYPEVSENTNPNIKKLITSK